MSFARSLFTVSGLTVLSRIGGFVRDTLLAMFLGDSLVADAFFVAMRLPNLFRSLFAEGAFSAAFVPLYTTEQEKHGTAAAQKLAGQSLAILLAILIPFSALIMLLMPQVMLILAPGFENDAVKFDLAVNFSLVTFPYLTLISITALQGGILNARNIFAPAAAAPIGFNIVLIIGLVLAKIFHWHLGYAASWSMTVAGVIQLGWLAISCRRAGVPIPLIWPRFTAGVKKLLRRIGPGAVGAGASQINLFVSTNFASSMPGAVSWLSYADRLNQLPQGIFGIAVATVLLPFLTRHIIDGQEDKARHYVSRAIEFCLLLGLPAAIGLALASKPIIQTLWQHDAFTLNTTIATASALAAYAPGIPAFLLVKVFASGFFARHDTATPVKISFVAMLINVIGCFTLIKTMGHVGLALSNSIALWANAGLLYITLRRRHGALGDAKLLRRAPRLILCAIGMGVLTWLLVDVTAPRFDEHGWTQKALALCAIIGGSSAGYAILLQLTGAMRLQDIKQILKPRAVNKAVASESAL